MTRVGTCGVESRSEVSGKCEPGSTWLGLRGYRCSPVGMDSDLNEVQERGEDSAFGAALEEGRHDRALAMAEQGMEDPNTPDWLVTSEGLRVALAADDPEQVVGQMSDARRLSLRRLGREPDALEHEVEAFRAKNAVGETLRVAAGRALDRRLGSVPPEWRGICGSPSSSAEVEGTA